ncbi:uncharacterized protein LOC115316666 [Ixodes scapularis]|uniref:uncharacterized protein LOC115316666 n=1 Tax=Ixodes scapularis TaxID=6945 RepID=UPI001A9E2D2F|nr:uncharacterized protein LOC115316666 [Ixodes scapularis]
MSCADGHPPATTSDITESDHTYNGTQVSPQTKRRKGDGDDEEISVNDHPEKMEETEAGEDSEFTLVQHRRQRTTGVPVLLTPVQEDKRLQQQNPLKLSAEVETLAGAPIVRHRFTARGGLLLDVSEVPTVHRLLKVHSLCGIPVQATIPKAYLQNFGLIKGVPKWYTDNDLNEFLGPAGVIAARRLYQRRENATDVAQPTDRVVLTFRPNTERPDKINLGFTRHEVTEYIAAPPRCFNCQALGHIAKYCKGKTKCKRCGEPHSSNECPGTLPTKCANCLGDHPASYANCKVRLAALTRKKSFIHGPKLVETQRELPVAQEEYPALQKETTHADRSHAQAGRKNQPKKDSPKRAASRSMNIFSKRSPTTDKENSGKSDAKKDQQEMTQTRPNRNLAYSDVLSGRRVSEEPAQESATSADSLIGFIFSALRSAIAQMPPSTLKTILQGMMLFETAIVGIVKNSQHSDA